MSNAKKISYSAFFALIASLLLALYPFYLKKVLGNKKMILQQIAEINNTLTKCKQKRARYGEYPSKLAILKSRFLRDQKESFFVALMKHQFPGVLNIEHFKVYTIKNTPTFSVLYTEIIIQGEPVNIDKFLYQTAVLTGPVLLKKFKVSRNSQKLWLLLQNYQVTSFEFIPKSKITEKMAFSGKNYLKEYSIQEFKLVGFLEGGFFEEKWALIQLPNKSLYKVKVSDELGLENGQVISFDDKSMLIQGVGLKKIELKLES